MVALSRLKATFEACLGLFRQNMKTLGRESRRGGMQKPRRRVRCIKPLPTMYSLQYTRRQKQLRTAENAWARAASVSVPYACRQSGPEASEKASLFGKWRWLGHAEEYIYMDICGVCAWCHSLVSPQVQRWPCGYRPSIQSRSPFDVPCHCSITQPNTCIHSLASIYSCGHSPFLMRTSSWMVWTGSCQPTLLVRKVFHSKLTEWQIWLRRKSNQVETGWG